MIPRRNRLDLMTPAPGAQKWVVERDWNTKIMEGRDVVAFVPQEFGHAMDQIVERHNSALRPVLFLDRNDPLTVALPVNLEVLHAMLDEASVPHARSSAEDGPMTPEGRVRWLVNEVRRLRDQLPAY